MGDRGSFSNMKILLVEDHEDNRRTLRRLIERRGHEVVAVGSAEEAEAVLASEKFSFLILDWMLPGKSGLELCRELRDRPDGDELFILLVTARSDTADLEQALEAGANDYLSKPIDVGLLNIRLSVAESRISRLLERTEGRAALRESARLMASILENTSDGFFSLDSEWKFTYVNSMAERLLHSPRGALLGHNFWDKFPELCGSLFETNYRKTMMEDVPLEFEATDPTGQHWFEVHAHPSNGGISVFFHDITQRKRLEEERLKTSKLESLGTLAGGIAHDLNNILTVISGNIGLAQIEVPETHASTFLPYLSKAGQAAQHAASLSGQLLTFAKGGTPLKKILYLTDLLRRSAQFSLRGSNLAAGVDLPPNLWGAEVDPSQIEQVINALILNAREAMPQGGTIRISARNLEIQANAKAILPAGRYVKISLSDAGPGISAELATKIFDPYFTTKASGSGLGLSISYSIVKKHGGLLQLESTSTEGSTFAFYLPAILEKPALPPEKRPNGNKPQGSNHFDRPRVLVMDDDAAVLDLTSQLLGTLGYQVTAVPEGLEAVRAYESALRRGESYQAVILDATVRGGMGGVATIERLRGLDPQVTAIICSGYSDEAALAEFVAYGFRAALPKPFTRYELADALRRATNSPVLN